MDMHQIPDTLSICGMNGNAGEWRFGVQEKSRPEKSVDHYLKGHELTLIRLIAAGKSNRQIAETIFLSEGRVKNMLTELYGKLNLKNRYELISYAYKNNLAG